MAAELFTTPARATDLNGIPYSGGLWYFYATGTITPQAVYADSGLVTPLANPVAADAGGKFPAIYFDPTKTYRGVLKDAAGATTVYDMDPINSPVGGPNGSATVGFLQSGTGAVARTVQSKLRDTVSVKDFGAVGDNTTDDTAAFQAAITQAQAAGQALFIPATASAYKLTSALNITASLRIIGEGAAPYVGTVGTRGSGSWLHFAHLGKGFNITNASALMGGIEFRGIGTYRDQTAPGVGWTPIAADYDIYIDNSDVGIFDVMLLNPTKGVYLTNGNAGRLTIDSLRGQAFQTMVRINVSYDVVRINNLHQWPFWKDDSNVHAYTEANLDAIYLERCDNPMLSNVFTIFAKAGIRLEENASGRTSKLKVMNADFDRGKYGIYVGNTMTTDGVTGHFVNLSFQGETGLAGSAAVYVAGNINRLNFVNFNSTYSDINGVYVPGANNNLSFAGEVRVTDYNKAAGTNEAFNCAATNVIRIYSVPTIFNGGSGASYGGAGTIYVDQWRSYTPTITSGTGTLTTASGTGYYKLWNDTCSVIVSATITTNGTGAGDIRASLPVAVNVSAPGPIANGRASAVSGKQVQGVVTSSTMIMTNYDNTYPGASGEVIRACVEYPV